MSTMQKRKKKVIEDLKKMLIKNGHTEYDPLQIGQNVSCVLAWKCLT